MEVCSYLCSFQVRTGENLNKTGYGVSDADIQKVIHPGFHSIRLGHAYREFGIGVQTEWGNNLTIEIQGDGLDVSRLLVEKDDSASQVDRGLFESYKMRTDLLECEVKAHLGTRSVSSSASFKLSS